MSPTRGRPQAADSLVTGPAGPTHALWARTGRRPAAQSKDAVMSELRPPRSQDEMDMSIFGDSHVRAYRESKGERGYIWNGAPILLLTTKGRKSGQMRTTPLIFVRDGDDVAVVASKGGAPEHPDWYQNLEAEPRVEVQVKGDVFKARARTATGEERRRLWDEAVRTWPQYEDYSKATDREIPVVVLEREHS
jgi:deazaflavin-dependent oxidoreductase (nitroreductase family)